MKVPHSSSTSAGLLSRPLCSFAPLPFGMSAVVMEAHGELSASSYNNFLVLRDWYLWRGCVLLLLAAVTQADIQQLTV